MDQRPAAAPLLLRCPGVQRKDESRALRCPESRAHLSSRPQLSAPPALCPALPERSEADWEGSRPGQRGQEVGPPESRESATHGPSGCSEFSVSAPHLPRLDALLETGTSLLATKRIRVGDA